MVSIDRVALYLVPLAPKTVRIDAIQSFECQETIVLRIWDTNGASGTGYSYTIGTGGSSIMALLRDHLIPQLIGRDPRCIEAIWHDLKMSTHATTVGPITSLALAAIDTALWDLRCVTADMPLHVMAGGARTEIPVYSTEGGWLHLSKEEIAEDAQQMKEAGFSGAKLKIGKPNLSQDMVRLEHVRETVGSEFEIMTDANQAFTRDESVRRARQLETLGIAWMEEPMPADDVAGHAWLAAHTSTPIAVGESLYSPAQFREYLAQDACSIVQVDVARVGGITPWLKVAHLSETYNVAVSPHFLMELHVSLVCAVANGKWLEYIPQLDDITHSSLEIVAGVAHAPTAAGLGIEWDWQAIERSAIGAYPNLKVA
ncbi:MAG: L-alanine-DL-glutamate epimerase-like enolase superfamily enzyme [Parvibaculaceae bacterium]|jgi:L-alanine-DL-glutamate epimerase-like enolase superfamily enzyme